jgi:hypothetical protein
MTSLLAVLLLAGVEPKPANCPEPPIVPAGVPRILKRETPTFPPEYFEQKIETEVLLQGTIDIDGNVGDVSALSCKATKRGKPVEGGEKVEVCRQVTERAEHAYRKFKYEPAMKDGKPICVYHTFRVSNKQR